MREKFEEANNKKTISTDDSSNFKMSFDEWKKSKGDEKKKHLTALRALYREVLYPKLK